MGISFSCPFAESSDVETGLESVIVKSISFGVDEVKTPVRSVNYGGQDLEPMILKFLESGKMIVERSVSFKGREFEKMVSIKAHSLDKEKDASITSVSTNSKEMGDQSLSSDNSVETIQKLPIFDPNNPKHQAAVKLQKVYKSFRTRRKLADCAVLVEQSWYVSTDVFKSSLFFLKKYKNFVVHYLILMQLLITIIGGNS